MDTVSAENQLIKSANACVIVQQKEVMFLLLVS